ncbi:MAG: hypothetical protein LAT61_12795 [Alcanivorax sp.]|nr:hypothetical protein [Alcanivorax sp.]
MNRPHLHSRLQRPAPTNPVLRLLMFIGAAIMLAVSLFLGAMIFLVLLGLGLVLGLVLMARVWWIRRKLIAAHEAMQQRQGQSGDASSGQVPPHQRRPADQGGQRPGNVIEGEYRRED